MLTLLGAPEVSRIDPRGTMSGVTQSIDTWSFGCVLSVAATWVVLGFQGVRQYEQLRQLASQDNTDRFHNGFVVLPEIRRWHNFLRGHLRPSDTATSLVLDLIENNMLQTETSNRMGLEQLCKRLQDILSSANTNLINLGEHSRLTDPSVLKALLAIEVMAQAEKSSKRETTSLTAHVDALTPLQRATMQFEKGDMSKTRPLGQTPYRREILKQELGANPGTQTDVQSSAGEVHNGSLTDSPTPFLSPEDTLTITPLDLRKKRPIKPDRRRAAAAANAVSMDGTGSRSPYIFDAESQGSLSLQAMFDRSVSASNQQNHSAFTPTIYKSNRHMPTDHSSLTSATHSNTVFPKSSSYTLRPELSIATSRNSNGATRRPYAVPSIVSPGTSVEFDEQTEAGAYHQHIPHDATPTSSGFSPTFDGMDRRRPGHTTQGLAEGPQWQVGNTWHPDAPSHIAPAHSARHSSYHGHAFPENFMSSGPSELPTLMTPPQRYPPQNDTDEKQAITSYETLRPEPLLQSVRDLKYDVCQVRNELDSHTPKGKRALVKGLFGREGRKPDQGLAETYGENRQIVSANIHNISRNMCLTSDRSLS
jgi:hypothetical protein